MDGFIVEHDVLLHCTHPRNQVVIPLGIKEIAPEVFRNHWEIQQIVISEGVTYIGEQAFMGCRNLREVVLP